MSLVVKNKRVLVLGLGSYEQGSGIAAVRFLLREGARLTITDMKTAAQLREQLVRIKKLPGSKRITYVLGRHRMEDIRRAELIVKNPGVPKDSPYVREARKRQIPIYNDLTLFLERFTGSVIGITGTRGKSTTAALAHEMLKKKYRRHVVLAGNIKISPLEYLDRLTERDLVVLEVSSWQANGFADIHYSPPVSVVLNVMDDHMNMYRSVDDYVLDKTYLWRFQKPEDVVILNHDNQFTRAMGHEAPGQRLWISQHRFSEENGCFIDRGWIIWRDRGKEQRIARRVDIRLLGQHNITNALAATALAMIHGISRQAIVATLRSFRGLPGRLELIAEKKGVRFYNDTCATTPDGTLAALRSFDRKPILIVGGTDKELDYGPLARALPRLTSGIVLLPGTATDKLLIANAHLRRYPIASSMQEAVKIAYQQASRGAILVLSPGAASFGIFRNEFDRGDQFIACVRTL